jgi:23S rRNA pseudouridine1911/1915/1917 synthase
MSNREGGEERFIVPAALDGARLDKAAAELATGLSVSRVKRAIDGGHVRVDGRRRAKGAPVAVGETITIAQGEISAPDAPCTPEPDGPLVVCFESNTVIVVDKRAGQPTAPLRAGERGTLANALVGRFPELAGVGYGPREPGILHRLDIGTSGLVVVARTADAFATLREALKGGRLAKKYLVVCESDGLPDEGTIAHPIANHPKDQRRVIACVHPRDIMRYAPREATTRFRVLRRGARHALVEASAPRALRHQIRVHFASIEHPLVGDALYGSAEPLTDGRHALHAAFVAFEGEGVVSRFAVESALPPELGALI